MKNKRTILFFAVSLSLLAACGGDRAPQQGNDTVSKADATKDTLNVDTNKNAAHSGDAGIKKSVSDTSGKMSPKK